jgi:hypothetical protein
MGSSVSPKEKKLVSARVPSHFKRSLVHVQLHSLLTSAPVGGGWLWVVDATSRPLYPRERSPIPIVLESSWAPMPILEGFEKRSFLAPTGFRTPSCNESMYATASPTLPGANQIADRKGDKSPWQHQRKQCEVRNFWRAVLRVCMTPTAWGNRLASPPPASAPATKIRIDSTC